MPLAFVVVMVMLMPFMFMLMVAMFAMIIVVYHNALSFLAAKIHHRCCNLVANYRPENPLA